jgi:mono/diheme cytochrome c family protein
MMRWALATLTLAVVLGTGASASAGDEHPGYPVYRQYCAVCHGLEADGDGPVAPVLKQAPADLRMLGQRYGLPLPEQKLIDFIDGREMPVAHGTREMPVWGKRLLGGVPPSAGSESLKRGMIYAIVGYLDSIQLPAE